MLAQKKTFYRKWLQDYPRARLWQGACAVLALALLLPVFPVWAGVSMDTGGDTFGIEPPPGASQARPDGQEGGTPSTGGLPQNKRDDSGLNGENPLPWGLVPEVYVPWLPGGGIRPPHRPRPSYPQHGNRPSHRPGAKPGKGGYGGHGGHGPRMQAPSWRHGHSIHRPYKESELRHTGSHDLIGASGAAGGAFHGGGGLGARPGGAPLVRPPVSSGVSGRPPGSPVRSSPSPSGFSDKAPVGAPERQLYPGMRPPLPGNTPQPVYPGEKPYAPGRSVNRP